MNKVAWVSSRAAGTVYERWARSNHPPLEPPAHAGGDVDARQEVEAHVVVVVVTAPCPLHRGYRTEANGVHEAN